MPETEPPLTPAELDALREQESSVNPQWLVGIPLTMVTITAVYMLQKSMRGPVFLGLYFGIFLVTIIAVRMIKNADGSISPARVLAFLTIEAIGLFRILYGVNHGMKNFIYLILGMIVGGILFFVSFSSSSGSTSDSGGGGFWFFGGCGGCGGGGCGG